MNDVVEWVEFDLKFVGISQALHYKSRISSFENFLCVANANYSELQVWNLKEKKIQKIFSYDEVKHLYFSPDEKFCSVVYDNIGKIFDIRSQPWKEIKAFPDIYKIKFSNAPPNQHYKICVWGYHALEIFDLNANNELKKEHSFDGEAWYFKFLPKSNILSLGYKNSQSKEFWNTNTWEKVDLDDMVKFSPDGILGAKPDKNNQLIIFNKNNGKKIKSFDITFSNNMKQNESSFNFSSKGTFLGILSKKTLNIYHTQTWKLSHTFKNVSSFKFFHFDTVIKIIFFFDEEELEWIGGNDMNPKIFRCVPYKNLYVPQNYKPTAQQNNIKNFFSGQKPKNVKYSDLNISFK